MKKILFLASIFALFGALTLKAQVKIGDLTPPVSSAALQVVSLDSTKGVLVPEMTVDKRDAIKNPADGLLIYNLTEECFNYWNAADGAWQSLCGGMAKAVYTVACSDIKVNGTYTQGTALNGSDYLSIQANVTKQGSYSITATTKNGYGFTTQGTFLNIGMQTVLVPGQGQPTNISPAPGDKVTVTLSGADSGCSNVSIPVLPPTATYSINCGLAKFNGAYVKNKALTSTNTVTLSVNVTSSDPGHNSWAVYSNAVNGISFSGSGQFSTTGSQTITLQGTGAPTTTDPITLTFTTNSQDGAATCTATVSIAIPPMTVLALGYGSDGNIYNYSVFGNTTADNYNMAMTKTNFGTMDNSTVKFGDGTSTWKILNPTNTMPTATQTQGYLSGASNPGGFPPDIVVIGYPWTQADAATVQAFLNYLQKGGVVLQFCEDPAFNAAMMNAVFGGGSSITVPDDGWGGGARYQFPMLQNDPIINGPFGNLGGAFWGEDYSTTATVHAATSNIAAQVITYTTENSGTAGAGDITAFRHNSLSWVWVGDGGFNSCADHAGTVLCPFYAISPNYVPMAKPVQYGIAGDPAGAGPVSNSIFTANALAWALNQAMANGINAAQR